MYIKRYQLEQLHKNRPDLIKTLYDLTNGPPLGSQFKLNISGQQPGEAFIAWDNGKVVGWGSIYGFEKNQIGCYVSPEHRRKGVGTKIVSRMIQSKNRTLRAMPFDQQGNALYRRFPELNIRDQSPW